MNRGDVCITFKSVAGRCAVPKTQRGLYYTHWRLALVFVGVVFICKLVESDDTLAGDHGELVRLLR